MAVGEALRSEEMKHFHKLATRDPRQRRDHLWEPAPDPRWLVQAWEAIRSPTGSRTAGIDSTVATDIDPGRIPRLSGRLRAGKERPKPVRRVYIAESNGQRRPLGIPTLEDRVVQPALRVLMGPIVGVDCYACAHGFGRQRSTHTA
jgi:RNA-directed DNA polymerase